MSGSPFNYSQLETKLSEDILFQEIITYAKRDGNVIRVTVRRDFFEGDYIDNTTTEVICPVNQW